MFSASFYTSSCVPGPFRAYPVHPMFTSQPIINLWVLYPWIPHIDQHTSFNFSAAPIENSSFIIIDGATVSAAASGVTISGTRVSSEAGGKTVEVGTAYSAAATMATDGIGIVNGVQALAGEVFVGWFAR